MSFSFLILVQFHWLHVFLKIYIRAFQQASDLDDSVEEKLLVGDRPKQTNDPGKPLAKRLVQRSEEEDADVSLMIPLVTAVPIQS
jgi:N-terminal acetyltransferase B complex non-catalytic subunit